MLINTLANGDAPMTDAITSFTPETLLDRLLFVRRFDRLLNTDASPEVCAENLKQIAYRPEGESSGTSRTVEIYPANADTFHFEIRHRARNRNRRRNTTYTLVKADGTLSKDLETNRTRVTGSISVDSTNIGTYVVLFIFVLLALFVASFRLMLFVGIGFGIYQAYVIRSAYLDLRTKLFEALEAS
jgi:hypothetical protein